MRAHRGTPTNVLHSDSVAEAGMTTIVSFQVELRRYSVYCEQGKEFVRGSTHALRKCLELQPQNGPERGSRDALITAGSDVLDVRRLVRHRDLHEQSRRVYKAQSHLLP